MYGLKPRSANIYARKETNKQTMSAIYLTTKYTMHNDLLLDQSAFSIEANNISLNSAFPQGNNPMPAFWFGNGNASQSDNMLIR